VRYCHEQRAYQKQRLTTETWQERAAWWLNPMSDKIQRLDYESQEKIAVGLEKMSSQNLLASETMLLERAARLEQVSI